MVNRTLSFGSRFEGQGDFGKALKAYQTAGMQEDADRMSRTISALEHAALFEENGFYRRSVDTLLAAGLDTKAKDLVSRLSGNDSYEAEYAKILLHSTDGDLEKTADAAQRLDSRGPEGRFLTAMAVAAAVPEAAKHVADRFSGKPIAVPNELPKAFMVMTDPHETGRQMASMLFWHMFSTSQQMFSALSIYKKLGMHAEAEGCLNVLEGIGDQFYSYGLIALRDVDDLDQDSLANNGKILQWLAGSETDSYIEYWDAQPAKKRYDNYSTILHDIISQVPDKVSNENFAKLIHAMHRARTVLADEALERLLALDEEIGSGDFERIKQADQALTHIGFEYIAASRKQKHDLRHETVSKCADAAFALETDADAQLYAGHFYSNKLRLDRAFTCAQRLVDMGDKGKAQKIYGSIAQTMQSREIHAQMKGLTPLRNGDFSKLYAAIALMEEDSPEFCMDIYSQFRDHANVDRLGERMIKEGAYAAVEKAAWTLSPHRFRNDGEKVYSPQLKPALERLASFGEEGRQLVTGIILEMTLPQEYEKILSGE